MRALVTSSQSSVKVSILPRPVLSSERQVLVKVKAIVLNAVDALYTAGPSERAEGRVIGSDFSGTVEEVGSEVINLRIGDRVSGFLHGGMSL
jgi:NADPH:quinone reductase-like Zn-dependent oxidoreductase